MTRIKIYDTHGEAESTIEAITVAIGKGEPWMEAPLHNTATDKYGVLLKDNNYKPAIVSVLGEGGFDDSIESDPHDTDWFPREEKPTTEKPTK